jgi:hypothetical protein
MQLMAVSLVGDGERWFDTGLQVNCQISIFICMPHAAYLLTYETRETFKLVVFSTKIKLLNFFS